MILYTSKRVPVVPIARVFFFFIIIDNPKERIIKSGRILIVLKKKVAFLQYIIKRGIYRLWTMIWQHLFGKERHQNS